MTLRVSLRAGAPGRVAGAMLAVGLRKGAPLPAALAPLDERLGGMIGRVLVRRDFRGARDETLHLGGGADGPEHVLLVGLGSGNDAPGALRRGAAVAARHAKKLGATSLAWWSPEQGSPEVEGVAIGLQLGAWEYTELKSPPPEDERRAELAEATIVVDDGTGSTERAAAAGVAIGDGINLARRLAMMPGNICTPAYLADTAREIAARHRMGITVLGRAELEQERMGSFLSVAQGTPQDPKLIAVEYRAGDAGTDPIVLVGKGLCFDSGGISIKPAQGMELMKFDMCGAAGVLGAMESIARLGLQANVIGLVGSTTNMPSGVAVKPGDVVQSHLGKSIEVINTDAEGRLVLADLLSYARRYRPAVVIDAATLTGACVIALGHSAYGVFGTDDALVAEVLAAGKRSGELGWRLPLWDDYRELIKSDIADLKNSGGRPAGSISAAMFLREFADSFPWVHLDIAGTAYSETDLVYIPKGPTGIPVGVFVEFVRGRAG